MHTNFLLAYLGIGIAAYWSLFFFFRRTRVLRKGLNFLWWGWLLSGDILAVLVVPLLWPIIALLSLLFWLGEYWHLISKRKEAEEKEAALGRANKYSHLSMNELLVTHKQVTDESRQQGKENHAN